MRKYDVFGRCNEVLRGAKQYSGGYRMKFALKKEKEKLDNN
jgi:hypothetical protein